ncbi:MAG: DUF87 domain-containing protein [Aggregatilineales bacterium]
MPFIEAPTTFYMGRRYDPRQKRLTDDVVYYDSRDLTTHAVVVGMTGSGKTGLCITLLEEAILDNIPAIIIDPKGDITNLLLSFPELQPQDFQPWVNIDDARRAGMDVPSYSADIAQQWRDGLASWSIVPDRIKWMKLSAQYSIYTPGSDAGLPISIVASLRAPREGWAGNEEAIREKINGITTALLALAGINAEPVKDKEHVLISNIFENSWRQGVDLTLEQIILQVQNPPFDKLGVFPIDEYMKEKDRFKLAMELNSIIASPSFQSWMNGQPIDIQSLLYQPNGRPRVSIFYIAHLNEQERMFITTLLLENMLGWMRTLSGTTSLRALLYIDEMFGYFPPYPKNPPTKDPILRLLKQARAFGLGLILATQNPGDLDYKGLTNAGTWFIGRLQSDNDRQKIMAGLQSMASADDGFNLKDVEELIADIAPRVFLMRNVHEDGGPILVHTRWAMSFLRGPLTRQQVELLMRPQRMELMQKIAQQYGQQNGGYGQQGYGTQPGQGYAQHAPPANLPGSTPPYGMPSTPNSLPGMPAGGQNFGAQSAPQFPLPPTGQNFTPQSTQPKPASNLPQGFNQHRQAVSNSVDQYFLPIRTSSQQAVSNWEQHTQMVVQGSSGSILVYKPVLLAQAVVRYQDRKASVYTARSYNYRVPELRQAGLIHWEEYEAEPINTREISIEPDGSAAFADLSPGLTDAKRMSSLKTEITDMLYNTARMVMPFNPDLKIYGNPDGEFSEYQAQVQQLAREQRDAEMDKISAQYASKMEKLEDGLRRKEQELRAESDEIKDRQREELFTTGEALLSLWKGRTNYTLSRMSRASRYKKQTKADIQESHEYIDRVQQDMQSLEQEFEGVLNQVNEKWVKIASNTQEYVISPYKKDIQLEMFGIGWIPYWYSVINGQASLIAAY